MKASWLRGAAASALAVAALSLPLQALAAPASGSGTCGEIAALRQQHPQLEQAYAGLQRAATQCASPGGLQAAGFSDLGGYAWAQADIDLLQAAGIMQGVGGGRFLPGATLTRAQLAALLQRVFRLGAPASPTPYTDVSQGFWGYGSVAAAAPFMGQLATPAGPAFAPNLPVTRADVAAAIGRIEVADGLAPLPSAAQARAVWAAFTDGSAVPAALSQYAAVAVRSQLMQGYGNGAFGPGDTLTRAQAAVLLARVLQGGAAIPAASALEGTVQSATASQLVLTVGGAPVTLPAAPSGVAVTLDGAAATLATLAAGQSAIVTLSGTGQVTAVEASGAGTGVSAVSGTLDSASVSGLDLTVGGMQLSLLVASGASLANLTPGAPATLTLDAAGQVVAVAQASAAATTATVTATIASVTGTTLTLSLNGASQSYPLAAGATVTVNGQAASLASLVAGESATATLNAQGQITALAVTGTSGTVTGTVASVGSASLGITANGMTQIYVLAPGATVTRNGQPSSLGALALGDAVTATLNGQGEVQTLVATGTASPSALTGTVAGINSYAVVLNVNGSLQALPLANGVNVTLNGQVTGLASVVAGDAATVTLNSAGQVVNIALTTATSIITGSVVGVNATTQPYTLILKVSGSIQTFVVFPGTPITIGGAASSLGDLAPGETATVTLNTSANQVTSVSAAAETATGYIVAQSASSVSIAVYGSIGASVLSYPIAAGAQITLNGMASSPGALPLGAAAAVGLSATSSATTIAASTPNNQIAGVLVAISASTAMVTINGTEASVPLGASPVAFLGGIPVAVTALPTGQTVTIDPGALGGSALLVR